MSMIQNNRSILTGLAALAIVVAAWVTADVDAIKAKGGPPGGKKVNVVDSVELDVNVVGSVEQDVRITGSALTHMGRRVEDHVTLILDFTTGTNGCTGSASFKDRILVRAYPDGTMEPDEFVVPDGKTLVITDVEWRSSGRRVDGSPLVAGRTLNFSLYAAGLRMATTDQTIDTTNGIPGANLHLMSGVLSGPGTNICSSVLMSDTSGSAAIGLFAMMVQGYLVDSF